MTDKIKRRPNHNQIERQRRQVQRDKLKDLQAVIPMLADQGDKVSMVAIISKATEYIEALRHENGILAARLGLGHNIPSTVGMSAEAQAMLNTPVLSRSESFINEEQAGGSSESKRIRRSLRRQSISSERPIFPDDGVTNFFTSHTMTNAPIPSSPGTASAHFLRSSALTRTSAGADYLPSVQRKDSSGISSNGSGGGNAVQHPSFFLTFREGRPSISRRESFSSLLFPTATSTSSSNGSSIAVKKDSLTNSLFSLSTLTEIDFASVACRLCCMDASKNDMVNCTRCLAWYHLKCLGLENVSDDWACCGHSTNNGGLKMSGANQFSSHTAAITATGDSDNIPSISVMHHS